MVAVTVASSHGARYGGAATVPRVAVVVSGWPRISETFALNELIALHRAGMLAAVVATKPGDAALVQPGLDEIAHLVTVLPAGSDTEPLDAQVGAVLDVLASLPAPVDAVHGYFAHRPAELAHAVARQLGASFGFSVHALDLRKVEPDVLRARAGDAALVLTCNADALAGLNAAGVPATLLPHGVDITRFTPLEADDAPRTGRFHLLAVGRLVEKKGFTTLLDAVAALAEADLDREVHLTIVGDGPDRAQLVERITSLGIADRVDLAGRATHADLPGRYRSADLVVVPSVVDRRGDRDGLPNVVLEAMASGRPIVASDVAAIASAIASAIDGTDTGVLVPAGDPLALAAAIADLVRHPDRRARLGAGARRAAVERFDLDRCATRFCELLAAAYAPATVVGAPLAALDGAAR